MDSYQVRFTCSPVPGNPRAIVMHYERVGALTQTPIPYSVTYPDIPDLDAAFISAGIYLHQLEQPDPERNPLPDPEHNYLVTDDTLRKLGFNLP
jgi:hypothetical protein